MTAKLVFIGMIILCGTAAYASASSPISSAGQSGEKTASLDVLGSFLNNTTIIIPDGTDVEVDIVGSTTSDLQIGDQPEQDRPEDEDSDGCGYCGEELSYSTPWDDFSRPHCYPYSSYIPTRYNKDFTKSESGHLGSGR
ncbi:MAG: hypothetical protein LUQ59_03910 [Methanothrix sp.]|nr:hypothetical protein [Methanothrix sp.]